MGGIRVVRIGLECALKLRNGSAWVLLYRFCGHSKHYRFGVIDPCG